MRSALAQLAQRQQRDARQARRQRGVQPSTQIFVPANQFASASGAPTATLIGWSVQNEASGWSFSASANQGVGAWLYFDAAYTANVVYATALLAPAAGAVAGNVVMQFVLYPLSAGDAVNDAGRYADTVTIAQPTTSHERYDVDFEVTSADASGTAPATLAIEPGDIIICRLLRVGTLGTDTATAATLFMGMTFRFDQV